MKHNCEIVRDLLPLYAEHMASPASTALVEEHLAECPVCRAELERMEKPVPVQPEPLFLSLPEFTLKKADGIQVKKTYTAEMECSEEQANAEYPLLEINAEEMAELWVNGKFAGASFWNKHRFNLKGLLHPGSNAFKLVVTGSLANRYGKHAVPYGLRL